MCLARTTNFTRAAEERNVTQSAFSRRIKALEIWAGTPLIDRTTYPVRLSEAGEEFLPVAKAVAIQLLHCRDDLRARDRGGLKFYAFAAPHSISITHLAPYLHRLEQSAAALRTRVMSDNLHICCQLITEGTCDFLLCYRHPNIPLTLDEQRFARLDLGTDRLIPVCVADDTGAPRWCLPGAASARIPYLAYAKGSFLGAVVDHTLRDRSPALDVRHMDAFAEALKSLALTGAGVAFLPDSSLEDPFAAGRLVAAGDEHWHANLTVSLFGAVDRLDKQGQEIWEFFAGMASHTAIVQEKKTQRAEPQSV